MEFDELLMPISYHPDIIVHTSQRDRDRADRLIEEITYCDNQIRFYETGEVALMDDTEMSNTGRKYPDLEG
ncbi:MAG: hypothetical protein Q9M76_07345 [Candidatus Dojkabacteria bacterium]|nr:hypothetical protein [Candidatus Dojkabacteria bacterium]